MWKDKISYPLYLYTLYNLYLSSSHLWNIVFLSSLNVLHSMRGQVGLLTLSPTFGGSQLETYVSCV